MAQVYFSLRAVVSRERITVNPKVGAKGEARAVRVPIGVLDPKCERIVLAFDCRLTPSRYKGERVRRMGRLLRGAEVIEVAGFAQAEHAGEVARALLGAGD